MALSSRLDAHNTTNSYIIDNSRGEDLHSSSTPTGSHAELLNASTDILVFSALTTEAERRADGPPSQRYRQAMESIWKDVNHLPEGQDKVVLSQLWALGKTPASPIPNEFPALATHGFIAEQPMEGQPVRKPATAYLKEFWRIGIHVSHAHGYTLQPRHVFQASLQAHIQMLFRETSHQDLVQVNRSA